MKLRGILKTRNEKMSKMNHIMITMLNRIGGSRLKLQNLNIRVLQSSDQLNLLSNTDRSAQPTVFLDLISSENQQTDIPDEMFAENNALRSNVSMGQLGPTLQFGSNLSSGQIGGIHSGREIAESWRIIWKFQGRR